MSFGFYKYYKAADEQREFTRENWARFHLEPLLIAEEDRNVARRYFAELKRRELVKESMSPENREVRRRHI